MFKVGDRVRVRRDSASEKMFTLYGIAGTVVRMDLEDSEATYKIEWDDKGSLWVFTRDLIYEDFESNREAISILKQD